jgi:hypothetical protein
MEATGVRLRIRVLLVALVAVYCCAAQGAASGHADAALISKFDAALRQFGTDHDRQTLREECNRALAADSRFALPVFYLGVLAEADEDWTLALRHFNEFLALEKDSNFSAKALREIDKLPLLIKEDSTVAGKLDRQYRQHLGYADLLQRQGFAREAFLEAAEACKLQPNRWEAYAVASGILLSQHDFTGASHFLVLARMNVPDDSTQKLNGLTEEIKRHSAVKGSSSVQH